MIHRRGSLATGLAAGAAPAASPTRTADRENTAGGGTKFRLKYAPHFGMFKNLGGTDPIDQLKFAADRGFTAWEDNGMMGKPVEIQEKIAQSMDQLGMEHGNSKRGAEGEWALIRAHLEVDDFNA